MESLGWNESENNVDFDWNGFKSSKSAKNLSGLLSQWDEMNIHPWHKIEGVPGQLKRLCEKAKDLAGAVKIGMLPVKIQRAILELSDNKPRIDWRKAIQLLGNRSSVRNASMTMKRFSKRYGTRPGLRISFKRNRRIAVAIDTSGSIDQRSMQEFLREIKGLESTGARIQIIECDCEVKGFYELEKSTQIKFMGGGGTLYDPVFEFINSSKELFDGCVYLTDGHAPAPKLKPKCKLLWVISPLGTEKSLRFGPSVRIQ